jgi:hypothetical protein
MIGGMKIDRPHIDAKTIKDSARELALDAHAWNLTPLQNDLVRQGKLEGDVRALVEKGDVPARLLVQIGDDLLRRGSDWNPFNNFGVLGSELRSAAHAAYTVAAELRTAGKS